MAVDRGGAFAGLAADRLRIFLCGDVMTGRGVDQILPHPGDPRLHERWASSAQDYVRLAERKNGPLPKAVDYAYIWGAALQDWRAASPDVRIANLETSVTFSEDYAAKGINYRMSPENVGCLLAGGFDCCVLANNHILDWGEAGLLETLRTLERHGVKTAGAGRDDKAARRPAVLAAPVGGAVLVIGLAARSSGVPQTWAAGRGHPGVNLTDLSLSAVDEIKQMLAPLRRPGDIVVASIHWGPNWGYEIADAERSFAHALIDIAGVAVVHGHSSHHPKAIEVYQGRLILYGCGDFLNDYEGITGYESFRGDLVLMYFADVNRSDGTLAALAMTPLRLRQFRLTPASAGDVAWLQAMLDREAKRFDGGVDRLGDKLMLSWPGAARLTAG